MNKSYTVTEELSGKRLDIALRELDGTLSRARIKKALEDDAVRLNGRRSSKGATVSAGDVIEIESDLVSDPNGPAVPTPDAELTVALERADLLVVDKPARQPTAPLRANETGTLANALVGKYPELAGIGHSPREPGLVHRIDNETSGLVLVARTAESFDVLSAALKAGEIEKSYLLLCEGEDFADEGTISYPLSDHPKDNRRVYACIHPRDVIRNAPRDAHTAYSVLKRAHGMSLVEVRVAKALRHQIRAHFSAMGFPLVGDELYGAKTNPASRHALHASSIRFAGEGKVAPFEVSSPLPADLQRLIDD
ncbi:MAG: RluA family pseudouridine synthase [Polyangiaceae bacterium]|nr:RluA family pseudouridine synthase [Polyangiaceae bacterium]